MRSGKSFAQGSRVATLSAQLAALDGLDAEDQAK